MSKEPLEAMPDVLDASQLADVLHLSRSGAYIRRIQPIIDQMNAIHWKGSREKFRTAHRQDIDLYYTSQRILKEKHGVEKIDISGWKQEQAALRQKEEERVVQYKPLRGKLDQMLNVKYCVETAKKHEQPVSEQQKAQQQRKCTMKAQLLTVVR